MITEACASVEGEEVKTIASPSGQFGTGRIVATVPNVTRAGWLCGLHLLAVVVGLGPLECKSKGGAPGGSASRAEAASSAGAAWVADAASVTEEMRAAACRGDAERFFSYVDEATLLDSFAKRRTDAGAQAQATAKADLAVWRKDIQDKGKDGLICGWTFVTSERTGGGLRAEIRTKSGVKGFLHFADVAGQPKLIDCEWEGGNAIASAEPVDMTVDVAELLRDYKGNELRGDNKYRGKRIRIIGKAGEFKRDITNTIYMTVGTGARFETPKAQCFFGDEYASAIASLTKGSAVVVNCTVEGLVMNVLMKDCSFPSVATLNACYQLQIAGIAKGCEPMNGSLEETGFNTAPIPPADLPEAKAAEWVERFRGLVVLLRDDAAYSRFTASLDTKDAGFGRVYVGSRAVRTVVILPPAGGDLRARVKAVVERLTAPQDGVLNHAAP